MTEYTLYALIFCVIVCFFAALSSSNQENNDDEENHTQTTRPQSTPSHRQSPTPAPHPSVFTAEQTLSEKKGALGEQIIKVMALNDLDNTKYRHFSDLIIPIDQHTTQIDNIIVSPFGIFVIEVKHFAGWIFGQAHQATWTHTLSRHNKFTFQNPLRQNHKHIKALSQLLRLPEAQFHSLIVFTHRDCQLKTALPQNVCLARDFIKYINEFKKEIINPQALQVACQTLSHPDWQATPEKRAQHRQQFQNP